MTTNTDERFDPNCYFRDGSSKFAYTKLVELIERLPLPPGNNPNVAYVGLLDLLGLDLSQRKRDDLAHARDPVPGHLEAWDHSWIMPMSDFATREERFMIYELKTRAIGGEEAGTIVVTAAHHQDAIRQIVDSTYRHYLPVEKPQWFETPNDPELIQFMHTLYADLRINLTRVGNISWIVSNT